MAIKNRTECQYIYIYIIELEKMQAKLCLITFNPVALIFSASWSTATLLGAQTKT